MRTIVTHPNNRKLLEEAFPRGRGAQLFGLDPLFGLPIKFNACMPERNIRCEWQPPADDRFVGYGPEDEEWMRVLGLGRIEEIDEGPLFYEMAMDLTFPDLRSGFRSLILDSAFS